MGGNKWNSARDDYEANKRRRKRPVIKKKRGCRCCMTVLIIFLVFLGAGVGVGYYFGDMYAKQYLDMSLSDVLSIAKDLRTANKKDIVTNGYQASDRAGFENEFKNQLFLKRDVDLNFAGMINELIGGAGGNGSTEAKEQSRLMNTLIETGVLTSAEAEDEGGDGGNNAIIDYIASLYENPDNIDKSRLKDFEEADLDEYLFKLRDKELAAFINGIMTDILQADAIASQLDDLKEFVGNVDFTKIIVLEQIIFESDEVDGVEIPHMVFTLSFDVRTVAKSALDKQGYGWAGFAVNLLLPEKIYITADLALSKDENVEKLAIRINAMSNERMAMLYKLVDNAQGDGSIKQTLADSTDKFLTPIADTVLDYGDPSRAQFGEFKLDIFETAISFSGMNEDKEGDARLTSANVYYALKYLLTSDYEKAIWTDFDGSEDSDPRYTWQDIYTKTDSSLVYRPGGVGVENDETRVDYEEKLMAEFEEKLCLNLTKADNTRMTFEELMWYFNIGENPDDPDATYDFTDLLDAGGLKDLSDEKRADIEVTITDQMLAAMLARQVDTLVGGEDGGSLGDMSPEIMQVAISVHESEKDSSKNHTYMEAGLKISFGSVLDGAGDFAGVIKNLLPEYVMISFKMDITLASKMEQDEKHDDTVIIYNDLTESETDRLLSILAKLGADFDRDAISEQINDPVRDAIKTMADTIPGLRFESSKIILPDIFQLTLDQVINDGDEKLKYEYGGSNTELTADDLQKLINKLYTDYTVNENDAPAEDYYGFLDKVIENYFILGLRTPQKGVEDDANTVKTFDELSEKFSIDEFDDEKIDVPALMHTAKSTTALRPFMTDNQLACLILSLLGSDMDDFKNIVEFEIERKSTVLGDATDAKNHVIKMTLKIELATLFGGDGGNNDFTKFIDVEELYVMVEIDLGDIRDEDGDVIPEDDGTDPDFVPVEPKAYAATIKINGMDLQQMAQLVALANRFAGEGNAFNMDEKALEIGKQIFKQLADFKEQMGDTLIFENGGIRIASIFELIANVQTDKNGNKPDAETLRGALQGLYAKDAQNSSFNYTVADIVNNPIATEDIASEDAIKFLKGNLSIEDYRFAKMLLGEPVSFTNPTTLEEISSPTLTPEKGSSLAQMKIYSKNRTNKTNPFGDSVSYNPSLDYIEFVFELDNFDVNKEDGQGQDVDNKYDGLVSSAIYVSVVIAYNDEAIGKKYSFLEFTDGESYLRINALSYAEQKVLFEVVDIDTATIDTQMVDCLKMFNNEDGTNDFFEDVKFINGAQYGEIEFTRFKGMFPND